MQGRTSGPGPWLSCSLHFYHNFLQPFPFLSLPLALPFPITLIPLLSPSLKGHPDPSATFWVSAAAPSACELGCPGNNSLLHKPLGTRLVWDMTWRSLGYAEHIICSSLIFFPVTMMNISNSVASIRGPSKHVYWPERNPLNREKGRLRLLSPILPTKQFVHASLWL